MLGAGGAISTVIIAQDEADRLEPCVRACRPFSREIVVVDGGSTDGTPELAGELGCRVVHNEWPGYASQRNFGAKNAANDWIFSVDCDELPDPELVQALTALKPQASTRAYAVRRINSFLGRWLTESPEVKARLYDRRQAAFSPDLVHELLDVDAAQAPLLAGAVWHAIHEDLEDATARMNLYTTLEAEVQAARRPMRVWRLFVRPPVRFGQRLILQRAYRHGWRGVFLGLYWAYWELLREMKVHLIRERARAAGVSGRHASDDPRPEPGE